MSKRAEVAALEVKVAALEAEVMLLRAQQAAHYCTAPACTCGGVAATSWCPVHSWPPGGQIYVGDPPWYPITVCAGAGAANPAPIFIDQFAVTAGAAAPPLMQTFTLNA